MSTQITMPPVRRTVTVKQPVDRAFALFTARIDQWWPRAASGQEVAAGGGSVVLEPRPGGRVYRRDADGSIEYWGTVSVWDPPRRLVLGWQPALHGPAVTEVEILFTPEGGGTRVDLEHRGWEELGGQAAAARAEYESAWADVLRQYAGAGQDNGSAVAALVLGLCSVVIPLAGLVLAPFAIVFGVIGRRRAKRGAGQGGLATAGLTLGAIGLVVWGLLVGLGLGVAIVSPGSSQEVPVPVESVQPR